MLSGSSCLSACRTGKGAALPLLIALLFSGLAQAGSSQPSKKVASGGSLEGLWSGGGTIRSPRRRG
jgi:hypothetical protein